MSNVYEAIKSHNFTTEEELLYVPSSLIIQKKKLGGRFIERSPKAWYASFNCAKFANNLSSNPPKKHIRVIVDQPVAGRPAKKQKLGNPLFTNILEIVLNLRKTLPESLQDDIETMSEEQEIEQEELFLIDKNLIQHPDRKWLAVTKEHTLYVPHNWQVRCRQIVFLDLFVNPVLVNKTDATVIFKTSDENTLLYYFEDSNLLVGDFEEFSERLYNSKTWYLVDDAVPIMNILSRTVV
ncbi:25498_t:CDS:2 [Gigaspora margarita]|uniref:25498_t:CDS:1 n=1 Tax=Gigaspora margarita TaxID=4874 RepID=A0ABM8VZY7_GIGMA|nr:25498_t:CDS:2 [Gigaspora margarita]